MKKIAIICALLLLVSQIINFKHVDVNADSSMEDFIFDKEGNTYEGNYIIAANKNYAIEYDYNPTKHNGYVTGLDIENDSKSQKAYKLINESGVEMKMISPDLGETKVFYHDKSYKIPVSKDNEEQPKKIYAVNETKTIKVANFVTGTRQDLEIKVIATGKHCVVWSEFENAKRVISEVDAKKVADEFDEKIYEMMLEYYGDFWDVDNDAKLSLVYYDIQDGYNDNSTSYIGGYFSFADMTTDVNYSNGNEFDFINLDTYPALSLKSVVIENSFDTVVHEMSHCISYSQASLVNNNEHIFDTWIEEGIAESAMQTYNHINYQKQYLTRIEDYNKENAQISLTIWEGSLTNYNQTFLFFQYLRILTQKYSWGGYRLYRNLMLAGCYEDNLFTSYLLPKLALEDSSYIGYTFTDLLVDFKIAVTINQREGKYGFSGEKDYYFKPVYFTSNSTTLRPGEVIIKLFSNVVNYNVDAQSSNIIIIGLNTINSNNYSIDLKQEKLSIIIGKKYTFKPNITGGVAQEIVWSSADEAIASVDNGVVEAKKIGTTTITASLGDAIATCQINVIKNVSASLGGCLSAKNTGSGTTQLLFVVGVCCSILYIYRRR